MLHSLGGDVSNLHGAQGPQHNPYPAGTALWGSSHTQPPPQLCFSDKLRLDKDWSSPLENSYHMWWCGHSNNSGFVPEDPYAVGEYICVCEGHMASPIYPGLCGRICVLTSWPVAGAEAQAEAEAEARGSALLQDFL